MIEEVTSGGVAQKTFHNKWSENVSKTQRRIKLITCSLVGNSDHYRLSDIARGSTASDGRVKVYKDAVHIFGEEVRCGNLDTYLVS